MAPVFGFHTTASTRTTSSSAFEVLLIGESSGESSELRHDNRARVLGLAGQVVYLAGQRVQPRREHRGDPLRDRGYLIDVDAGRAALGLPHIAQFPRIPRDELQLQ